mgnify:CR=1 FL=1
MDIMGIIRAQKVIGKAAIRREHRNRPEQFSVKEKKGDIFILNEIIEEKSEHMVAKELKREQVVDIMQGMKIQSISRMVQINNGI